MKKMLLKVRDSSIFVTLIFISNVAVRFLGYRSVLPLIFDFFLIVLVFF